LKKSTASDAADLFQIRPTMSASSYSTHKDQLCLKVAVPLPVRETFHYAVPGELREKVKVGCRVRVDFRNREVDGYVLEEQPAGRRENLKEILKVLDPEPVFHDSLVPFLTWMADYYLCPIGRLIRSVLPSALSQRAYKTARITEKGEKASGLLPADSEERKWLIWVKENPGRKIPFSAGKARSFEREGWIVVDEKRGSRRAGPLMRKFVRPHDRDGLKALLKEKRQSFKAANEFQFLETLSNSRGIPLKDLLSRFSNGAYLVRKWKDRGFLETYTAPVPRNLDGGSLFPPPAPFDLYEQQERVLSAIERGLDRRVFMSYLLHGITGSGKTEVYCRAIEYAIRQGRKAILMVPEIALAVYMEGIFRSRIGDRIAMYHSGLSEGERYDQWMRIARGEVDLVVGARSALFSPFQNLGLIIVDEEHDLSYKQEEAPRYQARDAAVVRGKLEKAVVLLGSGTPSVQSFYNAHTGRYTLLSMPDRVEKRPMPEVRIVDMKKFSGAGEKDEIISPVLKTALDNVLASGKQAMLFLNRRGFHRIYLCRSCGRSLRCPNCDLALIYHLKQNRLVCHYCGFYQELRSDCPSCGSLGLKPYGFGTERLEEILQALYPDRCIARMDRDSTRKKHQTFQMLKKFSRREVDILVGTQMITKGYDFPNVTLVGVIGADFSLGFPDFRAGERTFQLLSQVAGRAGRGDQRGQVIVQTFNPDHYAIAAAKEHDYHGFFEKEKELREQLGYPPFSFMACLRLQGNNKKRTAEMAGWVARTMSSLLKSWPKRGKEIHVLGPVEAPLSKIRGKYRWQIFVRSRKTWLLHAFLERVENLCEKKLNQAGVQLVIDIDPYQML